MRHGARVQQLWQIGGELQALGERLHGKRGRVGIEQHLPFQKPERHALLRPLFPQPCQMHSHCRGAVGRKEQARRSFLRARELEARRNPPPRCECTRDIALTLREHSNEVVRRIRAQLPRDHALEPASRLDQTIELKIDKGKRQQNLGVVVDGFEKQAELLPSGHQIGDVDQQACKPVPDPRRSLSARQRILEQAHGRAPITAAFKEARFQKQGLDAHQFRRSIREC